MMLNSFYNLTKDNKLDKVVVVQQGTTRNVFDIWIYSVFDIKLRLNTKSQM